MLKQAHIEVEFVPKCQEAELLKKEMNIPSSDNEIDLIIKTRQKVENIKVDFNL